MDRILNILLVGDVLSDAELIWREIDKSKTAFQKLLVSNKNDFLQALKSYNPDIIISDYSLSQFDGMTALVLRNELAPLLPFILITGPTTEEEAVEYRKAGADDYILKGNLTRLGQAVTNSINKAKLRNDIISVNEELRKSELRHQKAQSIAHIGTWELDLFNKTVRCSKEALKIYGFNTESHEIPLDILRKSALPEYRPVLDEAFDNLLKYNEIFEVEYIIERANDNALRSICSKGELIETDEDKSNKLFGVIQDITDHRKVDEELRKSEEKYRSIFENVQDLYYESSLDGTILEVSPSIGFLSHGQYQREDLIGESASGFYSSPGERQKLMEALEVKGSITDFETTLRSRDGLLIPCSISAKISLDNAGYPAKIIGSIRDISKRKKAEKALIQSRKEFQNYFESASVGLSVTLPDKKWIEVNQRLCQMLGYSKEELTSLTWVDVTYPDDLIKNLELFQQALDGKINNYELEKRFICKDRRIIHVATSVVCERNPDGTVHHFLTSYTDVTARVLADEKIANDYILLRTLIDNLPDPIYVLDKDCRKLIANKADVKNVGCKSESEVLGKTDIELFPGQIGVRGHADNKKVISSGKAIVDREEDFVNREGVRRWLLTTKIPLKSKVGTITGLVGIGHDITRRKLVEEELQQSYRFSESLLKSIPFGMDIIDEEGTILFQNDFFKRIFGEEATGRKCWELYHDDITQCSECPLTQSINIGVTEAYEFHGVLGNRIFEICHTGIMYQGKRALLKIYQDITDRKENEAELIRAKEKAEENDKLRTAFMQNISHEIRTPMNAIVGFSALLGEPDIDKESRLSYTEIIMQNSNHLLSVITDIVDISHIETNLVRIDKKQININETLKRLYNQFILRAKEKKLDLTYQTDLTDSVAFIVTDGTKLTQIISNLLSNALKFTDKGYVKFGYVVRTVDIEFFVEDKGIGIQQEYLSRIFDRFYKVQNHKSRLYEGTGLGLSISKAFVELLGGKIWLSSDPGKLTSFFFTIPYERQALKTSILNEPITAAGIVFPVKKTILIAEDVDSNFKLIKYFFSGSNTNILRARNGKEAVEKYLSNSNIDLILMDIKMPVMDGYTAVKLIREKNNTIPIIAQTAYADDKTHAIECGCTGFILKPFDKKGLLKVISEFI